jgi:tRNA(Ile)-lysidine synthase
MSASCSSDISPRDANKPVDERRRQQPFSPQSLAARLEGLPPVRRFWLAYSGGCDSHVLLHAAAELRRRGALTELHAVHVDHGLQAASGEWARHCAAVCAELQVPFTLLKIDARAKAGESPEAAARHARYRAIAELMQSGDCLLTAHHRDDQAETLLLQLLRGGGPHGLAAMPDVSAFAAGLHARPLLAFSRDDLRRYAQQQPLRWIDDPSNGYAGFDRNFLRMSVMPLLRERWPAAARLLSRGAVHQAEAAQLLDELAAQDLRACREEDGALRISSLLALAEARQRNVLRYWLKDLGFKLPDTVRLAHLQREVLHAAPDRAPEVHWQGVTVRRYRDRLLALAPQGDSLETAVLSWDIARPLHLPDGTLLKAVPSRGAGVKSALCAQQPVTVRYRRGGERCRPAPRASTRALKKLFQEAGVAPWERERIPLIYVGERLAAVAGHWVCVPCQAGADEEGFRFEWQRGAGVGA